MVKKVSATAEEPARLLFKLKLDHEDVYFGCEPIEGSDVIESDVVLDHAPDNPHGRYRWLRDHKTLELLPIERQKAELGAPTLEQAFHDFLLNGPEGSRVKAWRKWFESTLEGIK